MIRVVETRVRGEKPSFVLTRRTYGADSDITVRLGHGIMVFFLVMGTALISAIRDIFLGSVPSIKEI